MKTKGVKKLLALSVPVILAGSLLSSQVFATTSEIDVFNIRPADEPALCFIPTVAGEQALSLVSAQDGGWTGISSLPIAVYVSTGKPCKLSNYSKTQAQPIWQGTIYKQGYGNGKKPGLVCRNDGCKPIGE